MNIGWLWFDDDAKRTLEEKLTRALEAYAQKHGQRAEICCIHPSMLNGTDEDTLGEACGAEVRTLPNIRPNHFWIGKDETC